MRFLTLLFLILFLSVGTFGQYGAIYVEGVLEGEEGLTVSFRNTLFLEGDAFAYQETQSVSIDSSGKWWMSIGDGITTAISSETALENLDFSNDSVGCLIEIDTNGSFVALARRHFSFVNNAFFARSTDQKFALMDIEDLDTTGVSFGSVLVFVSPGFSVGQADSVVHSLFTEQTFEADTSLWVNQFVTSWADTVGSSFFSDSARISHYAWTAQYSDSTVWTDSAGYIIDDASWKIYGNNPMGAGLIGPSNKDDFAIRTNMNNRIRVDSNGVIFGTQPSDTTFLGGEVSGVLIKGPLDLGSYPSYSGNSHFTVLNRRGAFIGGSHHDTVFSDMHVGYNSFAFGVDVFSDADYSMAVGSDIQLNDLSKYSFSVGRGHRFDGDSRYGITTGRNCQIGYARNVAMGDSCSAPYGYACIAMGKNAIAHGNLSPCVAIGTDINNTGPYTHAFGYKINANIRRGCFVYTDRSSEDTLTLGLVLDDYDVWKVRAAGGVGFYTTEDLSTGVYLFSGSGSWSSTSSVDAKKLHGYPSGVSSKLLDVPVSTWNYKGQHVIHIGPMAQQLYSTLGYGEKENRINSLDMDGVIMAGIIELYKDIESRINELEVESVKQNGQLLNEKIEELYEKYIK